MGTMPATDVPDAAIDCHTHVLEPDRFPFAVGGTGYRPRPDESGDAQSLRHTLAAHGIAGAVVVQPSAYGTDTACTHAAVSGSGGAWRGVGAVAMDADAGTLSTLTRSGIKGVRINLVNADAKAAADTRLPGLFARLAQAGLLIQIQCRAADLCALWPAVDAGLASGARILFDHLGYPDPSARPDQPGFADLLRRGRDARAGSDRLFVKLSGAFRLSRQAFPHTDLDPFVTRIVERFGPDRMVWGSDWPFLNARQRPTYGQTLGLLWHWLPDAGLRRHVLCNVPARLFGFPAEVVT